MLKCYRAGNLRGAAEWIGRAIELDATVPRYHNNLAVALRNLGRLTDATDACRRALALDADYDDAHTNLGHRKSCAANPTPGGSTMFTRSALFVRIGFGGTTFGPGFPRSRE